MVAIDALAGLGLEELGFTEVPDALASPLSSPDHSSDGPGGRGGGGGGDAENEGRSVYVSNLAYAVSRAALTRLFSPCGEVRRVSIPLDPVGRCAGRGRGGGG
jgi:RNA recognition motif-containing protein